MPEVEPKDILEISDEQLPEAAVGHFLARARALGDDTIEDVYDFDRFLQMDLVDHYSIFFAVADRAQKLAHGRSAVERVIYAVDILPNDSVAGWGEISQTLAHSRFRTPGQPIIISMEDAPDAPNKDFARRRYLAMNAVALMIFGKPLHSRPVGSLLSSPDAAGRWEAFVKEGLAEPFEEADPVSGRPLQRFRFKVTA